MKAVPSGTRKGIREECDPHSSEKQFLKDLLGNRFYDLSFPDMLSITQEAHRARHVNHKTAKLGRNSQNLILTVESHKSWWVICIKSYLWRLHFFHLEWFCRIEILRFKIQDSTKNVVIPEDELQERIKVLRSRLEMSGGNNFNRTTCSFVHFIGVLLSECPYRFSQGQKHNRVFPVMWHLCNYYTVWLLWRLLSGPGPCVVRTHWTVPVSKKKTYICFLVFSQQQWNVL